MATRSAARPYRLGDRSYPRTACRWDAVRSKRLGRSDRAARCRSLSRPRRVSARGRRSNFATGRSAIASWKRWSSAPPARFLRAGYGKSTLGRAVPRQFAGSSRQFLRRAEGRRAHRASVAARRRERAVAQAHRQRRARARHHQPLGAAADGAEVPRQGPARSPDRLRGRHLGHGRQRRRRRCRTIPRSSPSADSSTARQSRRSGPQCRADDVALLQYTGGTTGLPKGAMLTPRQSDVGGVDLRRLGQAGARRAQRDRARDLRAAAVPYLRADGDPAVAAPSAAI